MTNQEYIQKALGITQDEYATAVHMGGFDWMRRYVGNDENTIKAMSHSSKFWKWWVNQWEIRDDEYVRATGIDIIDERLEGKYWATAFEEYIELHNVNKMKIRPNRMALEQMSQLIAQFTK